MAPRASGRVVFLPIRPRFARSIMSGKKKVEFRKKAFRANPTHVVVYASSPVQRVLGYFAVDYVDEDTPEGLWERYGDGGDIDREAFQAYYLAVDRGVAIGVGKVSQLPNPIPVAALADSLRVPQSFSYLASEAFERLRAYASEASGCTDLPKPAQASASFPHG